MLFQVLNFQHYIIYNNRSIIFYLVILITWSIFISKSKGKSLENNVELWIFISLTSILLFSFSGVYKSAILIIPLFILMNSNIPIRNENLYIFLIAMIFPRSDLQEHVQ